MTVEERGIHKIETFRDKTGRTVKTFTPFPYNGGKVKYTGVARIRVVPILSDPTGIKEKDFEFPFTDETDSIEKAFETFDIVCQKRVDENNAKVNAKVKLADTGKEESCET